MNTDTAAPDYGEPWYNEIGDYEIYSPNEGDAVAYAESASRRSRIIACVNACAGMPDPAAEIEAMREAMQAAYAALISFGDHTHQKHTCSPTECFCRVGKLKTALAKLQPFVKP